MYPRGGPGRLQYMLGSKIIERRPVADDFIRYPSFVASGARTLANSLLFLTGVRRKPLLLEGGRRGHEYRNWSGDRRHRARWAEPHDEQEPVELVRSSRSVRVVGSGHSFNDALVSEGLTVSLDRLTGIVDIDPATRRVTVRGGTRLRDLTAALWDRGLALCSLASHDAQSIGGILATDVHGTGRGPAHLSDQVVSLRLVDGTGTVHVLSPDDDLFRAAVGGLGAVGIITEVTVQCVEAFNLAQATDVKSLDWARSNLDRLLERNDHVSFYAYPFTDHVHVHIWDRTDAAPSFAGRIREALNEAKAAIAAAVVGDAAAHLGVLPWTAPVAMRLQTPVDLVHRSHDAFNRTQYHLHQELEVAVPRDLVWDRLREVIELYEDLYRSGRFRHRRRLPFLLVEVRFSPAWHDATLLGAGVDRETAWLCLCCNQSGAVGRYFAAVEDWVRGNDARIHLGKWCESFDVNDIARMHGDRFTTFRRVQAEADPDGRFVNPFIERLFAPLAIADDGCVRRSRQKANSSKGTA
ncbi:MAG: FAD-binding protein [Acidimicrobiia bacterium]|nr:FAD-binding protein [Acidimicrobiia bacterium]